MKFIKLFFAILILFVIPQFSFTQVKEDFSWMLWENKVGKPRWFNQHLGKENARKLTTKWDEIGKTEDKTSDEFAGTYFQYGWMSGYFLRWSSEKGFVYVNYFDIEHPCYFNYGKVSVNGDEVTFISEFETDNLCPSTLPKEMPKTWIPAMGGRYFIPKTEAKSFGTFYGGFGKFNTLHREFTDNKPFAHKWLQKYESKQKFILPKDFENFVKEPINGKIISIGKKELKQQNEDDLPLFPMMYSSDYYTSTKVKINVGRKHNVKKGLEFILMEAGGFDSQTLKVKKVKKNTSEGVVLRFVDKDKKEVYTDYDYKNYESVTKQFTPIRIGEKITTSFLIAEDSIKK